ncbi:hypothetical protein COCMIDRAFT_105611, partial [Bipolaris oryzae ATCC 44560]
GGLQGPVSKTEGAVLSRSLLNKRVSRMRPCEIATTAQDEMLAHAGSRSAGPFAKQNMDTLGCSVNMAHETPNTDYQP